MYAHLAKVLGCRALLVDCPWAPEHLHPTQVDACLRVYDALLAESIASGHIAVVGDSAGGNLCLQLVLLAGARGLPLPAACLPLSPWTDRDASAGSMQHNAARDHLLTHAMADAIANLYLGDTPRTDPLVNAMDGDFAGFQPVCLQVSGRKILETQVRAATARMAAAGVDAHCEVIPGNAARVPVHGRSRARGRRGHCQARAPG